MNEVECSTWHELIAMHVFSDLSVDESTRLLAHLDGCAECRTLTNEMAETFSLLRYVDPTSVEPTASVPTSLTERVLGDLRRAGLLHRRRRVLGVTTLALVGVAAALLLVVALLGFTNAPPQRTLALQGATSARANAVLVQQSWGTSLDLHEQGLPGGRVYTVSMETAGGTWWTTGTYRSVDGTTVEATMACAVPFDKITGIRIVNASGATVLSSNPSTPSYD